MLTGSGHSTTATFLIRGFGPLEKTNLVEFWFPPAGGERIPEGLKDQLQKFGTSVFLTAFGQSTTAKFLIRGFGPLEKTNPVDFWFPPAGGNEIRKEGKNPFTKTLAHPAF